MTGEGGTGSGGVRLPQGRGTAGLNAWARGGMERILVQPQQGLERVGGWGAKEREETEEARW